MPSRLCARLRRIILGIGQMKSAEPKPRAHELLAALCYRGTHT
jgi:hypothetical protein